MVSRSFEDFIQDGNRDPHDLAEVFLKKANEDDFVKVGDNIYTVETVNTSLMSGTKLILRDEEKNQIGGINHKGGGELVHITEPIEDFYLISRKTCRDCEEKCELVIGEINGQKCPSCEDVKETYNF